MAGIGGLCGNFGILAFCSSLAGWWRASVRSVLRRARRARILGAIWLWSVVRERPPVEALRHDRNPILRGSTRSLPSCESATTTTSRLPRSSGFPGAVPLLARSGPLASADAAVASRQPARHARRSGFVRHLGAVSQVQRRSVLADLYGREALRPYAVGGASGASLRDFHNYLVTCRPSTASGRDPFTSTARVRSLAVP